MVTGFYTSSEYGGSDESPSRFPLIFSPTPGSTGPIFWWLIGVTGGRFLSIPAPPLIRHGRYGSHLGFAFRRLSDERLRRLVHFWWLIWCHQSSPYSTSP
jgi:hypothetical protein